MVRSLVFIMLMSAAIMVNAEQAITLNGLFGDKVILIVDGEPVILEKGERKKGIKLLEVHEGSVLVEIDKKRLTLSIRDVLVSHSATAGQLLNVDSAKTHIVNINLIHQTDNLATFEVDYYYDGQHGEHVNLYAKTLFEGQSTGYSSHSYTRARFGRHRVTLTVSVNAKAPAQYYSDAIRFGLLWAGTDSSGDIHTRSIDFVKNWRQ